MNDQFYDRVDEQVQLCFGVRRWACCPMCDRIVYERGESVVIDIPAHMDRANPTPVFQMSNPMT